MKKISTKIILLSIINTLIVAMFNVGASVINNTGNGGAAAPGGAEGMPQTGFALGIPSTVLWGLVVSLIIGVIIAYLTGKFIAKPINMVTDLTVKTSKLDLSQDEKVENSMNYRDESGAMANALKDTRKVLRDMIITLSEISQKLHSHSDSLTSSAQENVQKISQVVATINEVAEGNNSQAETINQINAILTEMAGLVENITSGAISGADNASKSLRLVEEGQSAVDIQVGKMEENIAITKETGKSIIELNEMINQVGNTINIITSIADQTNLLALNAAIEAARAGEAGKGFAVVADQIRSLAENSSIAAKEIVTVINNTKLKTEMVVQNINTSNILIEEQKESLNITYNSFKNIRDTYEVLVRSFEDTAKQLRNANEKTQQIVSQTQDMAAIAEESAASMQEISATAEDQVASEEVISAASKQLLQISEELSAQIKKFKIK